MEKCKDLTQRLAEVAVSLPLSAKIPRDMRRGILRYARERGDWLVSLLEGRTYSQKIDDLKVRGAQGFFGYVSTDEEAAVIEKLHIPRVLRELDSGRLPPKVVALIARSSSLVTDSAGMGRMAADYYLSSRYPTFAYVGEPEPLGWSVARERAFVETLAAHGRGCLVYRGPETRSFSQELSVLRRRLVSLPKPIGIFVVHDERARQVLDACRMSGLAVPDEVGLLGCDNDAELCESAVPALSSIAVDAERGAYLAAQELARLMQGATDPRRLVYGALRVVERASTRLMSPVYDALVNKARELIEMNVLRAITPDRIAEELRLSRRQLERRFRAVGGGSVLCEINEARLQRAKCLLADDGRTLADVAHMLGFQSVSHFCKIYKDRFGQTPRASRERV